MRAHRILHRLILHWFRSLCSAGSGSTPVDSITESSPSCLKSAGFDDRIDPFQPPGQWFQRSTPVDSVTGTLHLSVEPVDLAAGTTPSFLSSTGSNDRLRWMPGPERVRVSQNSPRAAAEMTLSVPDTIGIGGRGKGVGGRTRGIPRPHALVHMLPWVAGETFSGSMPMKVNPAHFPGSGNDLRVASIASRRAPARSPVRSRWS